MHGQADLRMIARLEHNRCGGAGIRGVGIKGHRVSDIERRAGCFLFRLHAIRESYTWLRMKCVPRPRQGSYEVGSSLKPREFENSRVVRRVGPHANGAFRGVRGILAKECHCYPWYRITRIVEHGSAEDRIRHQLKSEMRRVELRSGHDCGREKTLVLLVGGRPVATAQSHHLILAGSQSVEGETAVLRSGRSSIVLIDRGQLRPSGTWIEMIEQQLIHRIVDSIGLNENRSNFVDLWHGRLWLSGEGAIRGPITVASMSALWASSSFRPNY